MQLDVREALFQRRPFSLGLLHAVLAEHALAGRDDGKDVLGLEGLGDGDERHGRGLALGVVRRHGDLRFHFRQALLNSHGFYSRFARPSIRHSGVHAEHGSAMTCRTPPKRMRAAG